ncbi:MAG: histidine kinase [Bacteroidota bacterium]
MKFFSPIFSLSLLIILLLMKSAPIYAQEFTEKDLIRSVRETKDINRKIINMIRLGEYYSEINLSKAESLRKKINYLSKQEGVTKIVEVDLFNAKIFKLQRNEDSFEASVMKYHNLDISNLTEKNQSEVLQNIGYIYLAKNNCDTAEIYLRKSLAIAEKIKDYTGICKNYCYLTSGEIRRSNKIKALEYSEKSIDAANKSKKKIDFAFAYLYQSFVYNRFGQADIALSKELSAYSYAKEAKNYPILTIVSIQIGDKQIDIQNYKEALYYYESALKYATDFEDFRLQGAALSSAANVNRIQGEFDEAQNLNNAALAILKKTDNKYLLGKAEFVNAQIYLDKDLYHDALIHLNRAMEYYNYGNNTNKIKEIYRYKGIAYKKRNQLNEALYFLKKSIDTTNVNPLTDQSFITYPMIADILMEQGKTKEAWRYMENFVQLSQKSKNNQAAHRIAELNELYRSEQRDELIEQQNNILEKQKRERELTKTKLENISLRNNLLAYIILGFIIIIVLATIIVIYRNRQIAIQQKRKEVEMSQVLLRTQMNPHFIFNAMSVIQSYIFENDVKNSSRFLVNFSRLIRLILENSPKTFINLETEVEILQKYLETQKLRFEDRFDYEILCPEELIHDNVQIPPMITQPFVENSIEHGQLHTIPNGKITITFSRQKDMLNIAIEDNGIGRIKSEELKISDEHKSMALQITRNRINIINDKYKAAGYLLISDLDEENHIGTKVLISLPYITEQIITH